MFERETDGGILSLDDISRLIHLEEQLAGDVLHLTANETALSPLAQRAMCSSLSNRYLLEHLDMRQDSPSRLGNLLYRGLDAVNEIERSATEVCRRLFGAEYAEFRCVSGLHAMQTTFAALTRPGDKIMRVSTQDGGHFLTELICRSFGRESCTYAFRDIGELDLERTRETFEQERPSLLYIDAMNYLFPLPIQKLRALVGDTPIIFDASHTLGLIGGKQFPNPLDEGADIIQANTHKTLFGPQKGIILGNNRALMERIGYTLSNGLVSSQHTASLLALCVALHELYSEGERYAAKVLHTARTLAAAVNDAGMPVLGGDRGFTNNHMFFMDARPFGSGLILLDKLIAANISANRLIPFSNVDAIRFGVQEIVRHGYDDDDLARIAGLIRRVVVDKEPPERVKPEVIDLVRAHPTVHFTGERTERQAPPRQRSVVTDGRGRRPRWVEINLEREAADVSDEHFRQFSTLGAKAGVFEHQVDSAGNISVFTGKRLIVTATGAYIRKLSPRDLVEVSGFVDGALQCRGEGPPSTEVYLHHLLRERLGARFVVHNHYIPDHRLERSGIASIPAEEYGSVRLAEAAVEAATEHKVFYVRRHGLVFWATTFDECCALLDDFVRELDLIKSRMG
ncbi:fluorothreonine transaldolase [Actinoallomurus sp. NBC_01490]|jgi:fluorothreonine transaldolase|uniref:fluorothreonine transaldolase n=1 Tax=Actinoallomurus sp. NBC_01490 TaxID=2903557 RepID=UPI002E33EB17|nr:fluorothreonine transaldolase [Actinoallomurus sp. NBC_01490]